MGWAFLFVKKGNMEKEPKHNKTKYYVNVAGKEVFLGPDNSTIYLHTFEPYYDHIFLENTTTDGGNRLGYFLWRLKHANFDEMVSALAQLNTDIRQNTIASEQDKKTFKSQGLVVPEFREPELETLTNRQVKLIGAFAYYLEHDHITPEDFNDDGELFI